MKRKLEKYIIEAHQETAEGRMYLKYNDVVGGNPIGLVPPFGYPFGVEEMGGPIKVYEECIRLNKTWEDLLNYEPNPIEAIY